MSCHLLLLCLLCVCYCYGCCGFGLFLVAIYGLLCVWGLFVCVQVWWLFVDVLVTVGGFAGSLFDLNDCVLVLYVLVA